MSKNSYKKTGVVIILATMAWLPPSFARAADACALAQNDFKTLTDVSSNTGDYLEKIRSELAVRRTLLTKIINCAISEARETQNQLADISINDERIENIKSDLTARFAYSVNYYEAEKAKVAGLGLSGSRAFAQNLREWRDGNYKPLAKEASVLLLWYGSQSILEKAQMRMDQIGGTMVVLKIVNSEKIQQSWKEAQSNFRDALDADQKATLSIKGRDPDQSVKFLHDSLAALAKTYQNFLDISKVFNPSER